MEISIDTIIALLSLLLGGGGGAGGGAGANEPISINGAKTQQEATDIITDMLMKRGMINGSREFQEAFSKAWADNNIQSLPFGN